MDIQYINQYCVVLKGKKEQVVIDPESLDRFKFEGRVVLSTHNNWNILKNNEQQVVVAGSGEYEVGGVEILGVSAGIDSTVYSVTIDGVAVGVLGKPKEDLTDKRIERIETVDVLLVPCDSESLLKIKTYLAWAKKWGVNYLIPIGYENDGNLKSFLDTVDREGTEAVASLRVNREELPEGLEVVVLQKR